MTLRFRTAIAALVALAPLAASAQNMGQVYESAAVSGSGVSPATSVQWNDSVTVCLGSGSDYCWSYAPTDFSLYSASLAGNVFTVSDGSADVSFNGGVSTTGASEHGLIVVDCGDDPFTVPATAHYVIVDTDTGSCTGDMDIALPAAAATSATQGPARVIRVKRFGAKDVVIDGSGAETIDGVATFTLTSDGQAISLIDTNAAFTDWSVF